MLSKIVVHVFVCLMQVGNLTVLLKQQHLVELNLFLETSNVTLELVESRLVATLF